MSVYLRVIHGQTPEYRSLPVHRFDAEMFHQPPFLVALISLSGYNSHP